MPDEKSTATQSSASTGVAIPPASPPAAAPVKSTPAPAATAPVIPTGPVATVAPPVTNNALTMLNDQLAAYVKVMGPGKQVTEAVGTQQQLNLWRTLSWVLKRPIEEFHDLWAAFLNVVQANKSGAFSHASTFRCFPNLKGKITEIDRGNFTKLLTLALRTSDPSVRAQVTKLLDMKVILQGFVDPGVNQRIVSFYSL